MKSNTLEKTNVLEKFRRGATEFSQVHGRVPTSLWDRAMAIKKRENIKTLNEFLEVMFECVIDFYEKKGGKP